MNFMQDDYVLCIKKELGWTAKQRTMKIELAKFILNHIYSIN